MSYYVPPGFWLLRDQEDREHDKALRDLLVSGGYRAFYVNADGTLTHILPMEWMSQQGEALIKFACHHYFTKDDEGRWISPIEGDAWFSDEYRQRLIVIAEVDDEDDVIDEGAKPNLQPSSPNRGGRPTKYNWEAILVEIGRFLYVDGPPNTQEALIQHVQTWYARTHGADTEPPRSDVQKRVSAFWKALNL